MRGSLKQIRVKNVQRKLLWQKTQRLQNALFIVVLAILHLLRTQTRKNLWQK